MPRVDAKQRSSLLASIAAGKEDLRAGRTHTHAEMLEKLDGRPRRRPDDLDRLIEKQRRKIPGFDEMFEETQADYDVAQKIYTLRASAGLTQAKLAKLIGTKASVIERLENADYDGHSLAMLRRVAAALDLRVELRCVLIRRRRKVT